MRRHTYEFDEIVIGSNLASVIYAYVNNAMLLFDSLEPPHQFERFEKDFPLDKIFFVNEVSHVNTPHGREEWGVFKADLYNRLLFSLSLSGLTPTANKADSIRIDEDNTIRVATKRARGALFKYKKLTVFQPKMIDGLRIKKTFDAKCIVHDRFKIKTKKHNFSYIDLKKINYQDAYIKKIWFVNNERRKSSKEIILESHLTNKELKKAEQSLISTKYKIKEIFNLVGIEKRDYSHELYLDYVERNVYYSDTNEYEDDENIKIDRRGERELCLNIPHRAAKTLVSLGAYRLRLNHLFMDSNGMIR